MSQLFGPPLRRIRREHIVKRYPIPDEHWQKSLADHPILIGLGDDEKQRLRDCAAVFMREKSFEPPPGFDLPDSTRLSIAVQASLPIINLGFDWIGDWTSVIVYPDEFVLKRKDYDDAGVMHEWDDPITGEAHPFGPVILSFVDVEASGWGDGYNVVIHEIAHKLDMREGGIANGCPPLHRGMDRERWQQVFFAAFEGFKRRDRPRRRSKIDPYAAENPSEFFAVFSEYFFERPASVAAEYPAVYEQLKGFYLQDPAQRRPRA